MQEFPSRLVIVDKILKESSGYRAAMQEWRENLKNRRKADEARLNITARILFIASNRNNKPEHVQWFAESIEKVSTILEGSSEGLVEIDFTGVTVDGIRTPAVELKRTLREFLGLQKIENEFGDDSAPDFFINEIFQSNTVPDLYVIAEFSSPYEGKVLDSWKFAILPSTLSKK